MKKKEKYLLVMYLLAGIAFGSLVTALLPVQMTAGETICVILAIAMLFIATVCEGINFYLDLSRKRRKTMRRYR